MLAVGLKKYLMVYNTKCTGLHVEGTDYSFIDIFSLCIYIMNRIVM